MNFKIYIYLFNIISTFCFKQPIPFADSSLSKRKIHKVAIPGNKNNDNHSINYIMISQSDTPIILYNKWLDKYSEFKTILNIFF